MKNFYHFACGRNKERKLFFFLVFVGTNFEAPFTGVNLPVMYK